MHSQMILRRAAGKPVPMALLEAIVKKYPTCAGFGLVLDGSLEADIVSGSGYSAKVLFDTLHDESFKDENMLLTFGNYPEGFSEQDRQPFSALKDGNELIALAFLHGQFPGFINQDVKRSQHHNFVVNHVVPTMADLWQSSGKDFNKFKAGLNMVLVKNSLIAPAVGRSDVVLLLKDGEVLTYSKDGKTIMTDFGWTTDLCKVVATETKKEEPKPVQKNKAGFVRATLPPPPPEKFEPEEPVDLTEPPELEEPPELNTTAEETDRQATLQLKTKTDTAIGSAVKQLPQFCEIRNGNEVWFNVSLAKVNNLHGNGLKKVIQRVAGHLPDGNRKDAYGEVYKHWKTVEAIRVQPDKLKGMDVLALVDISKLPKSQQVPNEQPAAQPTVPVTTPAEPGKNGSGNGDYVIAPDVNKKINAFLDSPKVKAVLDEHMRRTVSPTFLAEQEKKLPLFEESLGKSMAESARWSIGDLTIIGKLDPHALAVYAASWRLRALKNMNEGDIAEINGHIKPTSDKKGQSDPVQRRKVGFAGAA